MSSPNDSDASANSLSPDAVRPDAASSDTASSDTVPAVSTPSTAVAAEATGEGATHGGTPQHVKAARTSAAGSPLPTRIWLMRQAVQATAVIAIGASLLFLLGLAQRTQWVTRLGFSSGTSLDSAATEKQANGGEGERRYICPMMCTPPSSEPGRCPVCAMELVEATSEVGGDGISVTIEPAARRLAGIQTAQSKLTPMTRTIRTIGSIDFDESRLSTISAYVDGRLEKLYADYVGVKVNAGDDLALIYSPQLYSAQTEFVTSLESNTSGRFRIGNSGLLDIARESLSELGMSPAQIDTLRESRQPQSRIRIKSPQSGTVLEKSAVEGDYVKTGQKIFRIADLSTVWLMLDLFPDDAARVRFGQQVEAEIQSIPGEVFMGRVAFIDPTVNKTTRTVRVRVEVLNFDGRLRPGDYATARISVPAIPRDLVYDPALSGKYISPMHPQVIRDAPGTCPLCDMELVSTSTLGYATAPLPQQQVVTVPREAVLHTGESGVLYVETNSGRFEIRRVTVGPMNDTEAVIVQGLAAGETVATDGNFLIDSQMQLAGNPSLLDPSRAPSYAPGPLQLPQETPLLLSGEAGAQFDRTYQAYFEIQAAMAADAAPPPVAVNTLLNGLADLEAMPEVPDEAQRAMALARRHAGRLDGSLETARAANRGVSHALLQAANVTRGPQTAGGLVHYYCPMVPGGGGDWMQAGGQLSNPYWGSEMLRCGEVVRDMSLHSALGQSAPSAAGDLR